VTYGHLLKRIAKGELKRILVVATGALLSPLSFQQGESIPGIAHAVAIAAAGKEAQA
jgi:stage V sporulation protein AD